MPWCLGTCNLACSPASGHLRRAALPPTVLPARSGLLGLRIFLTLNHFNREGLPTPLRFTVRRTAAHRLSSTGGDRQGLGHCSLTKNLGHCSLAAGLTCGALPPAP